MVQNEALFAAILLSLSTLACINPGKVTGGGKLVGEEGHIASFGFSGDSCAGDLVNPTGHFNYVDKHAGVKMNGDLDGVGRCVTEEQWEGEWFAADCSTCEESVGLPSYLVYFDYKSTNPSRPGKGSGLACVKDGGEGPGSKDDVLFVSVFSGPFVDYSQMGVVQGNIQEHPCHPSAAD